MMATRIEKVARLAMRLSKEYVSDYGSYKSRKDFTQMQLLSCLILKIYLKAPYRDVVEYLQGHQVLREALGLQHKLPHFTTLQKFSARSDVIQIVQAMIGRIGEAALGAKPAQGQQGEVAIDSTGMETGVASAHYLDRSGKKRSRYVKLSVSVVCASLLPLALVMDWGPNNDKGQAFELLNESFHAAGEHLPQKVFADAGYDADWVHGMCREVWGVKSYIKAVVHRSDEEIGGLWRSQMTQRTLKRAGYGRRWHIESFFSGMKRRCGSALAARKASNLLKEAALKVLTYALYR